MSAVFRGTPNGTIEVPESWSLEEQILDISKWFEDLANSEIIRGTTLDIGFNSRLGPSVVTQGEVVPCEFMRQLASLDVTLLLSIYMPWADES